MRHRADLAPLLKGARRGGVHVEAAAHLRVCCMGGETRGHTEGQPGTACCSPPIRPSSPSNHSPSSPAHLRHQVDEAAVGQQLRVRRRQVAPDGVAAVGHAPQGGQRGQVDAIGALHRLGHHHRGAVLRLFRREGQRRSRGRAAWAGMSAWQQHQAVTQRSKRCSGAEQRLILTGCGMTLTLALSVTASLSPNAPSSVLAMSPSRSTTLAYLGAA